MPEYTHEFTMGETTEWDDLPKNVIPLAESDTYVKIALIDKIPDQQSDTVHAEKEALRNGDWDTAKEFRQSVDWGPHDDDLVSKQN